MGVKDSLRNKLLRIYNLLLVHFGPRGWWPGNSPLEIMVGAILTQNTNWVNVEKAIANLQSENLLSINGLTKVSQKKLTSLIRPSGYFNQKAKKIRAFMDFVNAEFGGKLDNMAGVETQSLRGKLLGVKGIGEETADSILLYALDKPVFVIDAYTRRVFHRLGMVNGKDPYGVLQGFFMDNLPLNVDLYNEYHALIVHQGKTVCQRIPLCESCVLETECAKRI
ncbi:endonuclease III domain-containing protein [candidate division KSB1 bacterium]|nr:endonuclease III domain-containing protein [candidate division KSB1 bacterium]